ncbi:hypothetical protein PSCICG_42850 [Pseudomonas cichorii]|nr:hypothetical protein PSCICG_42850 [Pseudomonas cichorii]
MIRADIGQPRLGWHMGRYTLQAHGQCLFVQLLTLTHERAAPLAGRGAILSSNGGNFKCLTNNAKTDWASTRLKRIQ